MSGLCGWIPRAGQPLDGRALRRFAEGLRYRSPEGVTSGEFGGVGLAWGAMRTGCADARAHPVSLGRGAWIVADARVDSRADLRRALEGAGEPAGGSDDDATLILRAWYAWGENCVARLLGDFAFAIWDDPRRTLFCARDPFGVKPFFHSSTAQGFVFSNTLSCLLAHPAVDRALDPEAIADFLLFERHGRPDATTYRNVSRLPAAHCLTLTPSGMRLRRYWQLPRDLEIRHGDPREDVERFNAAMRTAVADRLGAGNAGILMSGGLDSCAVARVAAELAGEAAPVRLKAHTVVYESLFADEERGYAEMAARHIGIPIAFRVGDGYGLFERYGEMPRIFPEPLNKPFGAIEFDTAVAAARESRVMLTGWDGDMLLSESPRPWFRELWRRGDFKRLLLDASRYGLHERKILPAGTLARLNPLKPDAAAPALPPWIDPDFATRLSLRERLAARAPSDATPHPLRPHAFRALEYLQGDPLFFEGYDPGCTGSAIEYRHPFLDLRVVDVALSLPPFPWCVRKEVLREAMRGRLPEQVRLRPKTPLAGYPHVASLARERATHMARLESDAAVWEYVDRARMKSSCAETDPDLAWKNLRPLALGLWLQHAGAREGHIKEPSHELA